MVRRQVVLLLTLSASWLTASYAQPIVINRPAPSIYIAVGTYAVGGSAVIDTVTFPLGAQPPGTPVPQVEAPVVIEIAYRRGARGTPRQVFVTMTPSPAAGLVDVSGTYFVPWTEFSWTSSNTGQLPSGTFTGAANQALVNFTARANQTQFRWASFTYRYNNTNTVPGGTYTGRVTFTATTP
jgi:hypothetical protein